MPVYFFSVLVVKKSDLVNFFFSCVFFSTKMRIHVFKDRKVSKHDDKPLLVCDAFCQSKANLQFETKVSSQRILWEPEFSQIL